MVPPWAHSSGRRENARPGRRGLGYNALIRVDDDHADHLWVDTAEVGEGSSGVKRNRGTVVRKKHPGVETVVGGGGSVAHRIFVGPRNRVSNSDRDGIRNVFEVLDYHVDGRWLIGRTSRHQEEQGSKRRQRDCNVAISRAHLSGGTITMRLAQQTELSNRCEPDGGTARWLSVRDGRNRHVDVAGPASAGGRRGARTGPGKSSPSKWWRQRTEAVYEWRRSLLSYCSENLCCPSLPGAVSRSPNPVDSVYPLARGSSKPPALLLGSSGCHQPGRLLIGMGVGGWCHADSFLISARFFTPAGLRENAQARHSNGSALEREQ